MPNPGAESTPGDPQPPPNPGFGVGRKLQQNAIGAPSHKQLASYGRHQKQRVTDCSSLHFLFAGEPLDVCLQQHKWWCSASTHLQLLACRHFLK